MASISGSAASSFSKDNTMRLDIESVSALATTINQHINALLANNKAWMSLKFKCTSKLKIRKQPTFEFSEYSIVSNLYWGIEAIDAATQAKGEEERTSRLQNSEKMLQVPASLHEQGFTSGIPNEYLICCSYFYLSVVRKLQRDDWQAALHFLQALLVSPRLVRDEFAPELCQSIMHMYIRHKRQERPGSRLSKSATVIDLDEDQANEIMGWMAKEYKAWLLYYQIMSNGEHDTKHLASIGNAVPDDKSKYIMEPVFRSANGKSQGSNLRGCYAETMRSSSMKCLKDILTESQSDTPISMESCNSSSTEETFTEGNQRGSAFSLKIRKKNADDQQAEVDDQNLQASCYKQHAEITACTPQHSTHLMRRDGRGLAVLNLLSRTLTSSFSDIDVSATRPKDNNSQVPVHGKRKKDAAQGKLELQDWRQSSFKELATPPRGHQFHQLHRTRSLVSDTGMKSTTFGDTLHQLQKYPEETSHIEQAQILERLISKLCFSETLGNLEEDYTVEISTVYKLLNNRRGLKYSLLKDIILDQLLMAISTSKKEQVIRASVTILSTIVSGNKTIIEDIKRKGLQLYDLATALRRNVHEASILIYLINPPPEEIKTLGILPCLVEVVCTSNSYKDAITSIRLTPRAASLMIIEILVTAFDYTTNNMHLSTISSPRVLSGLLDVPGNNNLEEFISLAAILVRCMRYDAHCRKFICEFAPITELFSLLRSNQKRATSTALEFFHELLRMPRSSAIKLLQEIRKEGSINSMSALLLLIQNSQPEHRLLAASLLLQLDLLEEASSKLMYREEAMKELLESLISEENSAKQALSAFILSNIGGTYSWTGEPYTVAWLAKRAGLTSLHHKNMIKNYDFSDESLQDAGIDAWCSKLARRIMKFGAPVFHDLVKGLDSKSKRISRDCLTAIAWIGCEVAKSSDELRSSACEILLNKIEQYVHPGFELEERLLACLCIYNYTLGRGMKKLIHFSEGVRESLRRLANVTWMAEELLRVADYFQPNKWRISCVHTQTLEVGHGRNGAVTALIYYRGQLCSGYADGSIKVWDIKGQTATLVQDMKNHNKAVTCFALLEQGNCLLSGSADKSIKIWQMVQRNLECIEIIATKESIQSIDTFGQLIFTISRGHKMKVFDASRNAKDIFKNKSVKAMTVVQGKVYAGCVDSSIQELAITNCREQEIRAPAKKWLMQNKPVNTLAVYKDWLYGGSVVVEGSTIKDWRRNIKPQVSVMSEKGANVLAMEVVEDFIYLNTAASRSSLQIWLRGTLHKVGRLSAGSKITSLLSANDMILCGTETGLIKGWIPL
ncbi:putative E3 ubiquitin-protein ligase LIN-1 isoform X1 [Coffea arabica]|uniref:E3 ubiquitin-protein ligase LIN-1 isoform X1 n=2 Tax=Coffea arabica TaxID=13443 RepID=A0A6P6WLA1_COFAR|nr:putative E3 ubiquitin-protein ligase LIN-1 isoform X1 [Coffea arabica]